MIPALALDATRPEDKIHGLYGICKGFGFELPAPDYYRPVATVYTEATRAIIRDEQGLGLLSSTCESSGSNWGLPSWVPNFSSCMRRWSPSNPSHMTVTGRGNPAVSGHTEWAHEFTLDGQALRVKGRQVDMARAAGLPWMTDASKGMFGGSPVPTEQFMTRFVESFGTLVDVAQGQNENCRDVEVAVRHLVRELAHATPQLRPLPAEDLEPVIRSLSVLVTSWRSGSGVSQSAGGRAREPQDDDICGLLGKIFIHAWRTVF